MDNVFPASYTQINLHIAMCVFSYNPLVLDSHPSINCVPFVKATLAMECPKSHNPFVFQFSQLLTFRTFAIPLPQLVGTHGTRGKRRLSHILYPCNDVNLF